MLWEIIGIKKIIIVLVVLVILIIISLTILSIQNKKTSESKSTNTIGFQNNVENNVSNEIIDKESDDPEELYINEKVHLVDSSNEYYTTEKSIKNYILYSKVGNQKAINALSQGQSIFDRSAATGKMSIKEMYAIDNDSNTAYFVNMKLSENTYYILVVNDFENDTFRVYKLSEEEYSNVRNGKVSYNNNISISKNDYNAIQHVNLGKSELAEKYFESYIQNAKYDTEEAYNSLDEEYRTARFGSYQNFVAYLSEETKAKQLESLDHNSIREQEEFESEEEYIAYINTLSQSSLKKYYTYTENDKEYYICLDAYDNFYTFEISSVMNYKLYLDSYTVDIGYFLNQYTDVETTIEEKGQINVEKIFEAINNKDYRYIYNKINNNVRNEMFGTYDNFVSYIKKNLFDMNNVEFDESLEDDNLCTEKLIVTDKEGKDIREISMTIILVLDDQNSYTITDIQFE